MREGSRTSLPSPPLLFIAFFTLHRSPLSESLEQATPQVDSITTQSMFMVAGENSTETELKRQHQALKPA